jgi:divalent metal cation (Fe/Co/Zn/Cd) transporter
MSELLLQTAGNRATVLRRAAALEVLTISWNVVEAAVAIAAAFAANSTALLGFGVDSVVESVSGAVLLWRLRAEGSEQDAEAVAALDRRAHQLVGISLFLLAAYVAGDAIRALLSDDRAEPTFVGIFITALSIGVMWWLARAKREAARALGSRALEADSFQTTACWWLSIIVLGGIGFNAALGWWWADPVAAIGMSYLLVREGRQAWAGDDCCD